MKPSIYRRIRRRSASHEAANANKESKQEQSFFGEATHETFFQPNGSIQRKCEKCEDEEKVQRQPEKKEEEKKLMRVEEKKEEDLPAVASAKEGKLQKKEEDKKEEEKLQKKDAGLSSTSSSGISNYVSSINGKGNPLPANDNHFFSSRMGYDFSNVKVHTDKEAADSAKEVNAKAYTIGNHIVFNEGQYNNESGEGEKLMAHELTHVMQQQNQQQKISRSLKDDTEKKFTVKITKGDKDWTESEIQLLVNALKRLNKKEAKVVEGYEFIRWSNRAERMKVDKSYIPPKGGFEENCLHEQNFKAGIYRITAYDSCFGDPEATSQEEYGLQPGEFKLLHEIGHLMQSAEMRMAYLEYLNATEKDKGKAVEKTKEVEGKSLKDFEKLENKKDPLYTSDKASEEQFAESFAIFKADPDFLKTKNKKLYDWFKKSDHLKRIK